MSASIGSPWTRDGGTCHDCSLTVFFTVAFVNPWWKFSLALPLPPPPHPLLPALLSICFQTKTLISLDCYSEDLNLMGSSTFSKVNPGGAPNGPVALQPLRLPKGPAQSSARPLFLRYALPRPLIGGQALAFFLLAVRKPYYEAKIQMTV